MAIVETFCCGFQVRRFRHSSSGSNWRFIVNSDGIDVVNVSAHLRAPFGTATFEFARDFPPEGTARVYAIGAQTPPFDLIPGPFAVDTAALNPSSIRIEMQGDDLLRTEHILLWGIDGAGAIVPLAIRSDLPNLSTDDNEGVGSVPLNVVDSGDETTTFSELFVYVSLTTDPNARTAQPVSFRIERADGSLVLSSGLEGFAELQTDGERNARIWNVIEATPASRVDSLGAVVPKLRVDGPDNAMISAVVAFGVNRDGPRPVVVPLVHHMPATAGSNPWVGTSSSPEGREMVLPLCATASRQ